MRAVPTTAGLERRLMRRCLQSTQMRPLYRKSLIWVSFRVPARSSCMVQAVRKQQQLHHPLNTCKDRTPRPKSGTGISTSLAGPLSCLRASSSSSSDTDPPPSKSDSPSDCNEKPCLKFQVSCRDIGLTKRRLGPVLQRRRRARVSLMEDGLPYAVAPSLCTAGGSAPQQCSHHCAPSKYRPCQYLMRKHRTATSMLTHLLSHALGCLS